MTVRGTKNSPLPVRSQPTSKTDAPKAPAAAEKAGKAAPASDVKSTFTGHTASIDVSKTSNPAAIKAQGKVVADSVMNVIGSYGKNFLLDTDGERAHVQQVATRFLATADAANNKGSVYSQLQTKFPGSTITLVGTASVKNDDQVYYLVKAKDGSVHKFEDLNGKLKEAPDANGQIFMASELGPGKQIAVRVPDVKFLINPTLPPDYGVGRNIVVRVSTPITPNTAGDKMEAQGWDLQKEILPGDAKGEDGSPLGMVHSPQREEAGKITKYDGNGLYDVEVTAPDGKKSTVKLTEQQIRTQNDPTIYDLKGSTYSDIRLDIDHDPSLKKFCDGAQAIIDKDIVKTGTPEQISQSQKQALTDLTIYCNKVMSYPDEDPKTTDEGSKKYMALENAHSNWNPAKLGDIIDTGKGVCRDQAILMQVCCQMAGIGSRMVTAKADDDKGNFRGYHAFLETTLDDGTQYLTDPTWYDAGPVNVSNYESAHAHMPDGSVAPDSKLFDTLYLNARRQVLPTWNEDAHEVHNLTKFNESNDPVIDGGGVVTAFQTVKGPDGNGSADDAGKAFDQYFNVNRGAYTLGAKADLGHGAGAYKLGNSWAQDYQSANGPTTLVTSPKGTFALVAPARDAYAQGDNAAKLGAPTGQATQINGTLTQQFENGTIKKSPTDAAAQVVLNAAPQPVDTSAFLDALRRKEYNSDYKDWWPNWDPHQAAESAYEKYGDMNAASDPKAAAAYYALGIEFGNGATPAMTKEMWGKLADALGKVPGFDAEVKQARLFAQG